MMDGSSRIAVRRMSDVTPRSIEWLWPGRIALGKVTMFAGDPGLGKSLLSVAIAVHVTQGTAWPVDNVPCATGEVIMVSGEDDPEDTIRPRLDAAGADVSRVHFVEGVHQWEPDGRLVEHEFEISRHIDELDMLLKRYPDVSLITIDPLSAYLGDTDSHNTGEVRGLLKPLAKLAYKHRVAIVGISHLNKATGSRAMYRVTGSLAFVAAARAVWAVTRDKDDPNARLILPVKNNLGPDDSGLAYSIVVKDDIPVVAWHPDPVTVTVDEALSEIDDGQKSVVDEAIDWLREELREGQVKVKNIQRGAKSAGLSWASVRRAKDKLKVRSEKQHFSGEWVWVLNEGAQTSLGPNVEHLERLRGNGAEDAQGAQDVVPRESEHLGDAYRRAKDGG